VCARARIPGQPRRSERHGGSGKQPRKKCNLHRLKERERERERGGVERREDKIEKDRQMFPGRREIAIDRTVLCH